jgi:hypothetical protein
MATVMPEPGRRLCRSRPPPRYPEEVFDDPVAMPAPPAADAIARNDLDQMVLVHRCDDGMWE